MRHGSHVGDPRGNIVRLPYSSPGPEDEDEDEDEDEGEAGLDIPKDSVGGTGRLHCSSWSSSSFQMGFGTTGWSTEMVV